MTTERIQNHEDFELLTPEIKRQLIVVKPRMGPLLVDFNPIVVENQAEFGRDTSDYETMVVAHGNCITEEISIEDKILGVREETRKAANILIDGRETKFVEAEPSVRNIWVGRHVKLYTPEDAAKYDYGGQTALRWATRSGVVPEMVVKASNGYFYPATKNDIVVTSDRQ
jgi:hypothetical protein